MPVRPTDTSTLTDLFEVGELPPTSSPPSPEERGVEPSSYFRLGHRVLNLALLALVLPGSALLIPVIALGNAFCLRSFRRVFFLQDRVGQHGKTFRIYKFRTMDAVPFPDRHAARETQRVTRFGRFLRNTHLDELPQLFNVIRGEMCFIGPRPEMVEMEDWARERVPGFDQQRLVKPGLSGLAQITQGYVAQDEEGYSTKLEHNLFYIRNASLRLDLSIIARTAWWILRRRGWRFEPALPDPDPEHADGTTIRHWARGFLDLLEERTVPFAVLRGAEVLAEGGDARDVDMLVAPADLVRIEEHLRATCRRFGVSVHEHHHAATLHQYYVHARTPEGEHQFFAVDVHTAECCLGVPYLTAEELLQDTRLGETVTLCPIPAAVVNFLTPFMSGAWVHEEYAGALGDACRERGAEAEKLLGKVFGSRVARRMRTLIEERDLDSLRREARSMRRSFLVRASLRHPLRTLRALAGCVWSNRVRPLWRPRGRFVAFLGTDGSGKTTVIEAVRQKLADAYRSDRSKLYHMRPGLLPQINTLLHFGHTTYTLADMARPHRARPSGPVGSALRVLYYWADYVLGYALLVLPRRRRHSLIVFDRYFFDYRVDPLRSRIRLDDPLANRLARRVPRPDDVVVCTADPQVISARKDELPPEEVERQVQAYEELARREGYHVVRTDGPVDAAVDQALSALFPHDG